MARIGLRLLLAGLCCIGCDSASRDGSSATCSKLAEQYSLIVDDATICTVGDNSTCAGRVPMWGAQLDANGNIVEYSLSECPFPGSGIAVNPARTAQLDALLATYEARGCTMPAGPGCGAPGQETLVGVCVAAQDGVGRCQKLSMQH